MGTKVGAHEMAADEGASTWWEARGRTRTAWLLGFAVVFGAVMAAMAMQGQETLVLACCTAAVFTFGCGYGVCNAETDDLTPPRVTKYEGVLEALLGRGERQRPKGPPQSNQNPAANVGSAVIPVSAPARTSVAAGNKGVSFEDETCETSYFMQSPSNGQCPPGSIKQRVNDKSKLECCNTPEP